MDFLLRHRRLLSHRLVPSVWDGSGGATLCTAAVGAEYLCSVGEEATSDEGSGAAVTDKALAVPVAVIK